MPKTDEEIRRSLQEMVNGFAGIENPEEILKKADWFDLAAGVHNLNLTQQILGELLHRETPKPTLPAQDPAAPEPPAESAGPSRQDVIQTTIEFYDTKNQARRLLLVAGTTDNHEYVCFNITSAKQDKDNAKYPGNVFIPKTAENHLDRDSFVKCDVEYIISPESIYSDLRQLPVRLSKSDFDRVTARYELLKAQGKVKRVYNSVDPKKDEFDRLRRQVVEAAENYRRNPKLVAELVDFRAKFYSYSFKNTVLIMQQNRYATFVASFKKWRSLGYHVNKGEKGLKVIVPYDVLYFKRDGKWRNVRSATRPELDKIYRKEIETQKKTYFTVGYVFDISQTSCPPADYPKFYDMGYASAGHAALYESLRAFAEKSGFTVAEKAVTSIALKGFYRPGDDSITINDKLNDSEKLATLTHEFSHALMHKTSTQSKEVKEFEAECLSHMILRRLGLPLSDSNKDYIATYYGKIKDNTLELENSFRRIKKAYDHATEGFDRELAAAGIEIGPERGQKQTRAAAPAEKLNENFLRGIE